jgi:hypothetical protein
MQRLTEQYPLQRGSHPFREDGMCAMEMVAWLAGEAHSDEPMCACPVLTALVRAWNDAMSDQARNLYLRPLVPMMVQTRSTRGVENVRGLMAVDCLVRRLMPTWMERHHRLRDATLLRELQSITRRSDVLAASQVMMTYAGDHRAARWVLDRAHGGMSPEQYVPGVIQFARALSGSDTWQVVGQLVQQLVAVKKPVAQGFVRA